MWECFDLFVLTYDLDLEGHDLCELTFWALSPLLLGKTLLVKEFDGAIHFDQ